jgi:GntR family transcriptional regulator
MHLHLSQASGVPFYRQVEDQIADLVRSGTLAPGAPLPSVRQLAAELLVSVITIKKAYEDLEAAGLVVSRQGRGTFVAEGAGQAAKQQLTDEIVGQLRALIRRARALGVEEDALRRALEDE